MSLKRQAVTELNHENWDKEDPEEQEDSGTIKTASADVLEKRVIRTAKRRSTQPQSSTDEAKKSVFSGFGGFNKTQPSSFDFLANLTNGSKNTNNEKTTSNDTPISNTLFTSKPATGSPTGIFGITPSPVKTSLGSSNSQTISNLFSSPNNKAAPSSVFTAIKADSTVKDSPFKIQSVTSTGDTNTDASKPSNKNTTATPTSHVTSNIFGISSTSGTTTIPGKSLFATNNNTSSLFKTQSTNSTSVSNTNAVTISNNTEKKCDDKNEDKKITYYTKLKGLNESVSDWIKKHVEETPLCILSPIFKDYEKYLKEMQDEYEGPEKENSTKILDNKKESQNVVSTMKINTIPPSNNNLSSTLVSKTDSPTSKPSIFGNANNTSTIGDKPAGFAFGANSSSSVTSSTTTGFKFGNNTSNVTTAASTGFSFGNNNTSTVTTASTGFTFGNKTSAAITTSASTGFTFGNNTATGITTTASTGFTFNNTSTGITTTPSTGFTFGVTSTSTSTTTTSAPFSFTPTKTTNTNGAAPFSFGTGKPFSFNSNITQKVENTEGTNDAQEEEDTPPKVEFTPIAEENSIYDKRCKIFIKKDGNFVDKGVGTLYIKKIEDSDKHQLLIRANTTLGNVLLNLRMSSAIPTQRMGKNNVMLVCIPTPETKPPPTPVLIRVKTAEEADELLETLNKYKS